MPMWNVRVYGPRDCVQRTPGGGVASRCSVMVVEVMTTLLTIGTHPFGQTPVRIASTDRLPVGLGGSKRIVSAETNVASSSRNEQRMGSRRQGVMSRCEDNIASGGRRPTRRRRAHQCGEMIVTCCVSLFVMLSMPQMRGKARAARFEPYPLEKTWSVFGFDGVRVRSEVT